MLPILQSFIVNNDIGTDLAVEEINRNSRKNLNWLSDIINKNKIDDDIFEFKSDYGKPLHSIGYSREYSNIEDECLKSFLKARKNAIL